MVNTAKGLESFMCLIDKRFPDTEASYECFTCFVFKTALRFHTEYCFVFFQPDICHRIPFSI